MCAFVCLLLQQEADERKELAKKQSLMAHNADLRNQININIETETETETTSKTMTDRPTRPVAAPQDQDLDPDLDPDSDLINSDQDRG